MAKVMREINKFLQALYNLGADRVSNNRSLAFGNSRGSFGLSRPLQRTGSMNPAVTPRSNNRRASAKRPGEETIGAEKVAPHGDRPGGRRHVERQRLLDLVQQVERIAALAVELC
jgi:hypothetical protein